MDISLERKKIPNEDYVFRNTPLFQFKQWSENKRRPNEADFIPDLDGLSVNWEKYCTLEEVFILIGLSKNRSGNYLDQRNFKTIQFNVGVLRSLTRLEGDPIDVIHDPKENNYSHSLVCYSEDEEEIRVKLCELVHQNYESMVMKPADFSSIEKQIEKLKCENPTQ